jgi:hypothetical protein
MIDPQLLTHLDQVCNTRFLVIEGSLIRQKNVYLVDIGVDSVDLL